MTHPFLRAWRNWKPVGPPYVLAEDRAVVERLSPKIKNCYRSWTDYVNRHDFVAENSTALHLGLLPQPFFGNPARARIVVLTLNPGVGPHDYFGEYHEGALRRALLRSMRNRADGFLWLDPRHSWHGGFAYWHGRLQAVIRELTSALGVRPAVALRRFRRLFACVELLPYHSERFGISSAVLNRLKSVQLARAFAHDVLLARARAGKCLVVVARSAERWNLAAAGRRNVVVYEGSETRAAFLTPATRGGDQMLKFLMK